MKFKNFVLSLGMMGTVLSPIVVVIACSGKTDTKPTQEGQEKPTQEGDATEDGTQEGDATEDGTQEGDATEDGTQEGDATEDGTQEGDATEDGTQEGDATEDGTQEGVPTEDGTQEDQEKPKQEDQEEEYNVDFISSNMKYQGESYKEFQDELINEEQLGNVYKRPMTPHFFATDFYNFKNDDYGFLGIYDEFFKSKVPLKETSFTRKHKDSQKENNKLALLGTLSQSTSLSPVSTVSRNNDKDNIFSMWNLVDIFVAWGGSASEGQFLLPKAEDIDAAHQNGTKVIATYFAPPNAYGGSNELYEDLVKKDEEGNYIVADGMIAMAKYYGFDGWFFNLESDYTNETKEEVQKFLKYFNNKKGDLNLEIYQWHLGGNIWDNSPEIHDNNYYVDFQARYLEQTPTSFYGYDFDRHGYNPSDNSFSIDNYENVWIYDYFKHDNRESQGKDELGDLKFFNGLDAPGSWKPFNDKFLEKTVLNNKDEEFTTTFNLGFGSNFFLEGNKVLFDNYLKDSGYKNQGLQDILPTWRYLNYVLDDAGNSTLKDSKIQGIKISDNAFFGSSVLDYDYKFLDGEEKIATKLYGTNFNLESGASFKFVYKKKEDNSLVPKLALWTDENSIEHFETIDSTIQKDLGNGFIEVTFEIPNELNNKKMFSFGTVFEKNDSQDEVKIDLSLVNYKPKNSENSKEVKLKNVNNIFTKFLQGRRQSAIDLEFENLDKSQLKMNVFYSSSEKNGFVKDKIIGISNNNSVYINDLPKQKDVPIIVETYDVNYNKIAESNFLLKTTFEKFDKEENFSVSLVNEFNNVWNQDSTVSESANGFLWNAHLSIVNDNGEEEIFMIDNNGKLRKIDKNGHFISNENNFGNPLVEYDGDIEKAKIFDLDEDNILVSLWKSQWQNTSQILVVDKKSGEVRHNQEISTTNIDKLVSLGNKQGKLFLLNNDSENIQIISIKINDTNLDFEVNNLDNYQELSIEKLEYIDNPEKIAVGFDSEEKIKAIYKIVFNEESSNWEINKFSNNPDSLEYTDYFTWGNIQYLDIENDKVIIIDGEGNYLLLNKNLEIIKNDILPNEDQDGSLLSSSSVREKLHFFNISDDGKDLRFLLDREIAPPAWWGAKEEKIPGGILSISLEELFDENTSDLTINFKRISKDPNIEDQEIKSYKNVIKPQNSNNYLMFDNYGVIRTFNLTDENLQQSFITQLVISYNEKVVSRKNALYNFKSTTDNKTLEAILDQFIEENLEK